MESIIAVLILIGALIVGGNTLDKEATRSNSESAATATLADREEQDCQACDTQFPPQRDLTVPNSSRTTPAPVSEKVCDE